MRGVNFTEIFRNSMYCAIAIFFSVAIVFLVKSFPLISGAKTIETSANTQVVSLKAPIASITSAVDKLGGTVDSATNTVNRLGDVATNLSDVAKTFGTDSHRTIRELDYPILQFGLTSKKEADSIDGWNLKFGKAIDDLDVTINTANTVVGKIIPIETATTESVNRFNAMMADPKLAIMETHIGGILKNVDGITYTTNAVFTKATHSYLNPSHNPFVRGYQVISPFLIPAAQVGGAVAIAIH